MFAQRRSLLLRAACITSGCFYRRAMLRHIRGGRTGGAAVARRRAMHMDRAAVLMAGLPVSPYRPGPVVFLVRWRRRRSRRRPTRPQTSA